MIDYDEARNTPRTANIAWTLFTTEGENAFHRFATRLTEKEETMLEEDRRELFDRQQDARFGQAW